MSLEQEYQLEFFKKNGFERRICPSCGHPFWTQDPERTLCGDPPCVEYEFIGTRLTDRAYTASEMRERFLSFFEEHGHTRVGRYPVVARWRDDIYLTIASIADFQPHVTSGLVPPPANPLTISQPCIRLNDLDSVGKSGRHLTTFEMMAHHVFNTPDEKIYFKERCTELCHAFLTGIGIASESITYKEKPWAGGGNAGAAFEVLTGGLEVATLVFMNLVADPEGPVELYGERYREMDMKIVDTGYGLERLTWCSTEAPTIYEALYPEQVRELLEASGHAAKLDDPRRERVLAEVARLASLMDVDTGTKVMELRKRVHERLVERGIDVSFDELLDLLVPLEKVYAIADHVHCLAFMLGDGIVPSNVKAGYLARLMIRRTLRLMDELGLTMPLRDLVTREIERLATDYPDLPHALQSVQDILDLETERYRDTLEKGRRLVEREAKGKQRLDTEKLIDYYDSHGLPPDVVKAVAEPLGVEVEVPDDFYTRVATRHSTARKTGADAKVGVRAERIAKLPSTKLLYYESGQTKEFEAVVLYAKDGEVVLDQTAFYPEGGGQPADTGFLSDTKSDTMVEVVDTQKLDTAKGPLVVHTVKGGKLRTGDVVKGRIDWGKRVALTRNHTATHIIAGAARRVLGPHVWQAGTQKGIERTRIDLTHFERITDRELREIEQLANMVVLENLPVEKVWLPRDEAEKRYGMQLYQGGIPEGREVRVVRVHDFDVECCAGTHVRSTQEVGPIKLLRAERVQDGVERLEFTAGIPAVNAIQEREALLKEAAETLDVPMSDVPKAAKRFFDEWKQLRKEVERLQGELAAGQTANLLTDAQTVGGVKLVAHAGPLGGDELGTLGKELTEDGRVVAILGSTTGGDLLLAASGDALDLTTLRDVFQEHGGKGGGRPDFLRGKVAPDQVEAAVAWARARASDALNA